MLLIIVKKTTYFGQDRSDSHSSLVVAWEGGCLLARLVTGVTSTSVWRKHNTRAPQQAKCCEIEVALFHDVLPVMGIVLVSGASNRGTMV